MSDPLNELIKKDYHTEMDDVEKALFLLWEDVLGFEFQAINGMGAYKAFRTQFAKKEARIAELERALKVAVRWKDTDAVGFDWKVLGRIEELERAIRDYIKVDTNEKDSEAFRKLVLLTLNESEKK